MAGWDWLRDFRLRNPSILLRTPEATSAGRAQGFPEHLFSPAAPTDRPENINHSMSTTTTQPPVQTTAGANYVKPQEILPMPSASRSGEKKKKRCRITGIDIQPICFRIKC